MAAAETDKGTSSSVQGGPIACYTGVGKGGI